MRGPGVGGEPGKADLAALERDRPERVATQEIADVGDAPGDRGERCRITRWPRGIGAVATVVGAPDRPAIRHRLPQVLVVGESFEALQRPVGHELERAAEHCADIERSHVGSYRGRRSRHIRRPLAPGPLPCPPMESRDTAPRPRLTCRRRASPVGRRCARSTRTTAAPRAAGATRAATGPTNDRERQRRAR